MDTHTQIVKIHKSLTAHIEVEFPCYLTFAGIFCKFLTKDIYIEVTIGIYGGIKHKSGEYMLQAFLEHGQHITKEEWEKEIHQTYLSLKKLK